jgi:CRISPR-associated protein Csb2
MINYLCISVSFLDPLYHGKGNGGASEWPPSPLRLFQALVAGSNAGCHRRSWSAKESAFQWLEKCEPPEIVASPARPALAYTAYVPSNDSNKKLDRKDRLTSKVHRPHRIAEEAVVHYLWRVDSLDYKTVESAEKIAKEAKKLLALGWGIDVVVGNGRLLSSAEADAIEGERWYPRRIKQTAQRWRVPKEGTLKDVIKVYESGLRRFEEASYRPPDKLRVYDEVFYLKSGSVLPRPFADFALEPLNGRFQRRAFSQTDAAKVSAMLRHAASKAAERDSHEFPGGWERYVTGGRIPRSEQSLRFSYLPLPSVGHPHVDGMIRRVLIVEPYGGDGSHADWASRHLCGSELTEPTTQKPLARLAQSESDDKRMVETYVKSSNQWVSVTPVVLPGFDEGKYEKALGLLRKAVLQAGLTVEMIEDVILRKAPFLPGSEHPSAYFRPDYLRGMPAWHVLLQFHEPISGPLAIGAGRHIGLGLFVPA